MGKENENSNTESPELNLFEEFEQNDEPEKAPDKKPNIEPLKEFQDDSAYQATENITDLSVEPSGDEADSAPAGIDEISEITQNEIEVEIPADTVVEQADDESAQSDPPDDIPNETSDSVEEDLNDFSEEIEAVAVEEIGEAATTNEGKISEIEKFPNEDEETAASDKNNEEDFIGLDDDEIDVKTATKKKLTPEETDKKSPKENAKEKKIKLKANSRKAEKTSTGRLSFPKVISLALLAAIITGIVIYTYPSLLGLKKELKTTSRQASMAAEPVQKAQKQVYTPPNPPSKEDLYVSRLEDATRLRDELLEKKKEIYNLKVNLQNGIAELQDQTIQEVQKEGITTLDQALKNKGIELNLRTIQRRQNYIQALEKPAHWIRRGSEELLYLKRKAQLDLQVIEIAAGIDLDKHMRHISAAIQKYQPSAEKLAIDPQNTNLPPLKTIWSQIIHQQDKNGQMYSKSTDKEIIEEICSGYFKRTAELSGISEQAAKCLSKKNGSDLFLNGVKKISPSEAKLLFQWPGNWICLNGVKELTPAVAEHLFKWEGTWISLNGLTKFPPELAKYLMKWNGKQLELMGLNYVSKNVDKKALKYLALWETAGGKLFVPDDVRKIMQRVMM